VPIVSHVYLSDALEQAPILWRMKADLERLGIGREQRKAIFDRIGLERLSPVLPPDRQLWIMARNDAYITAAAVERQWQAWGQPPIEWIPGGHMTFPFSLGRIVERTAAFHRSLAPLAHGATST